MTRDEAKTRLDTLREVWDRLDPNKHMDADGGELFGWVNDQMVAARNELKRIEHEERSIGILRPLFDRVVCEVLPKETVSKGGIILPDTSTGRANRARVIATGRGERLSDGTRIAPEVSCGEKVIFHPYNVRCILGQAVHGTPAAEPGDRFIIDEDSILAVEV